MEKVLELRMNKEKRTMERFAALQNVLLQQKSVLTILVRELGSLKEKGLKYKNIEELKHQNNYKQSLEEKINKQNERIHQTSQNLEHVRLELVAAQKDRKIIEKIKEKDFISYKDNIKMQEQKELDEIAVLRFQKTTEN